MVTVVARAVVEVVQMEAVVVEIEMMVPERAAVGSPEASTDIGICVLRCMTRALARRRARTTHYVA